MRSAVQNFRIAARETIEETRQELIATAKREHQRVMRSDPRPARFTRTVDGRQNAPEEAVRADGRIVYDYGRLAEVVQFAMEALFDLSPVLSGEYRSAHRLFVGGAEVRNLEGWNGEGDVVISNSVPYARKIELGKMTMRVPGSDQVYQQAQAIVQRRYHNVASVHFTYQGIIAGTHMAGRDGNVSDIRYPALIIWSRSNG